MKHYIFKKENNDFDEIINDSTLKNLIFTKIKWKDHIMLGIETDNEEVHSYILLKYGDDLVDYNHIFKNRKPTINVDYISKEEREYKQLLNDTINKTLKP